MATVSTAHPTNPNEFYFMSSRTNNAIYKITINSNHTWSILINWTKGRYGYGINNQLQHKITFIIHGVFIMTMIMID